MSSDPADRVPNFASPNGGKFLEFIDWLNEALYPVIGPADLGPYGPVVEHIGNAVCPICGKPMSDHLIERTQDETYISCRTA